MHEARLWTADALTCVWLWNWNCQPRYSFPEVRKHQHAGWLMAQPAPAGLDTDRTNYPPKIFF